MRFNIYGSAVFTAAYALAATSIAPLWPVKTFLSEPALHPLVVNTTVTGKTSPGYLFIATDGPSAAKNGGPLIVDENGDEIWISNGHAFNFGPQIYKGKPVITWWNGTIFPEPIGRGYGNVLIADESYNIIANVSLPGYFQTATPGETYASNIDLHEVFITDRNTVTVTANNVTTADLTSVGGSKDGWVVESQVYEIDIETGKVLFTWKSLDHLDQIPFTASIYPLGSEGFTGTNSSTAWAYFHVNAVEPFEDGYLLSSRYLSSVVAIDKHGHVKWRLQGRDGADFKLASDAHFDFQHDARHVAVYGSKIVLSVHDNANSPLTEPNPTTPSSGLLLEVDLEARTAKAITRYLDPKNPIYSSALGSYGRLLNGNVLVGHGFVPVTLEFSHDGDIVATTQYGTVVDGQADPVGAYISYRSFKSPWFGCPTSLPAVGTIVKGDKLVVAMSWNGATGVEAWKVWAGDCEDSLKVVNIVRRESFETTVEIEKANYVQVEAISVQHSCAPNGSKKSKVVSTEA